MLRVGAGLKGYAIEARDGRLGTVDDFLFDDSTWRVRWLVVDTGGWLSGRQVLVHPSAIGAPDDDRRELAVNLTKAQVEASPSILRDQPVSLQMQNDLYGHYGWDPLWGGNIFGTGMGVGAMPFAGAPLDGETALMGDLRSVPQRPEGDPRLRSMTAVIGYHIEATDGGIGHVQNLLIDDERWDVRYFIIKTRNWWPGNHVLIAPAAVQEIMWSRNRIQLNVARVQVETSPAWQPEELIREDYQQRLHSHYAWPGYGW